MLKTKGNKTEILFILDNLRYEDEQELINSSGKDWKKKTLLNLEDKTCLVLYGRDNSGNQVPIAMGGFCDIENDEYPIACVWLLSTSYVYKNKMLLMKELRRQIMQGSEKYRIMYNFIYKSNFEAKKWLRKLGFKFDNPKPSGLETGKDFEFFYKVCPSKKLR